MVCFKNMYDRCCWFDWFDRLGWFKWLAWTSARVLTGTQLSIQTLISPSVCLSIHPISRHGVLTQPTRQNQLAGNRNYPIAWPFFEVWKVDWCEPLPSMLEKRVEVQYEWCGRLLIAVNSNNEAWKMSPRFEHGAHQPPTFGGARPHEPTSVRCEELVLQIVADQSRQCHRSNINDAPWNQFWTEIRPKKETTKIRGLYLLSGDPQQFRDFLLHHP